MLQVLKRFGLVLALGLVPTQVSAQFKEAIGPTKEGGGTFSGGTVTSDIGLNGNSLTCSGETTDAAPDDQTLLACSAWDGSSSNTSGGDWKMVAGTGTKQATVATFSNCATDTFTVTVDGSANVLTEGTGWVRGASNAAACTSLAAAVEALSGVGATCSSTTVRVSRDSSTKKVKVATSDATCLTVVNGTDGTLDYWHDLVPGATDARVLFADGSAGLPSGANNGDEDTGFYWPADNTFGVVIGAGAITYAWFSHAGSGNLAIQAGGNIRFRPATSVDRLAAISDNLTQVQFYGGAGGTAQTKCGSNNEDGMLYCTPTAGGSMGRYLLARKTGTIAADDTTPDVSGALTFYTSANTVPTAITDLDNPVVGQEIKICGGSDTNSSTIADSGNFNIQGAFTASLDDCITLCVQADNDYHECAARTNN